MATAKPKKKNSLLWVIEPLEEHPSFILKPMFGCLAAYYKGKLVVVLADKEEPWNGVMVCTYRERHEELKGKMSSLQPHPVLGKWLYLSQDNEDFEELASQVIELVINGEPGIGVCVA